MWSEALHDLQKGGLFIYEDRKRFTLSVPLKEGSKWLSTKIENALYTHFENVIISSICKSSDTMKYGGIALGNDTVTSNIIKRIKVKCACICIL